MSTAWENGVKKSSLQEGGNTRGRLEGYVGVLCLGKEDLLGRGWHETERQEKARLFANGPEFSED